MNSRERVQAALQFERPDRLLPVLQKRETGPAEQARIDDAMYFGHFDLYPTWEDAAAKAMPQPARRAMPGAERPADNLLSQPGCYPMKAKRDKLRIRPHLSVAILLLAALSANGEPVEGEALAATVEEAAGHPGETARDIIQQSGVRGGLVVHLGCGDGRLTAALRVTDSYLVQGLELKAGRRAQARAHIRSAGLYGPVSVAAWDGVHLPYAENLVNLIVAEQPNTVAMDELMRALAPRGVAMVNRDGAWTKTVKPWPDAKLNSFHALAPGPVDLETTGQGGNRLEKGPAYGAVEPPSDLPGDWPTYRHNAARSGSTAAVVPFDLAPAWQTRLPAPLTPPVAAAGRVYAASPEMHTLHALDGETGAVQWQFTTGGRVDSPPTVWNGLVLFGSADGWVYCLRAEDGELVWRHRAAPKERLIVADGQLESAWPVHGSVLVLPDPDAQEAVVYAAAGRSGYLDGGIDAAGDDSRTNSSCASSARRANGAAVDCAVPPKGCPS